MQSTHALLRALLKLADLRHRANWTRMRTRVFADELIVIERKPANSRCEPLEPRARKKATPRASLADTLVDAAILVASLKRSFQMSAPLPVRHFLIRYSEHGLDTSASSAFGNDTDPIKSFVFKQWRPPIIRDGLSKKFCWC